MDAARSTVFARFSLVAVLALFSLAAHAGGAYWAVNVDAPIQGAGRVGTTMSNTPYGVSQVIVQQPVMAYGYEPQVYRTAPPQVVYAPAPVYAPRPVLYAPAPVFVRPWWAWGGYHHEHEREREWAERRDDRHDDRWDHGGRREHHDHRDAYGR
jgi:hypothetical protein